MTLCIGNEAVFKILLITMDWNFYTLSFKSITKSWSATFLDKSIKIVCCNVFLNEMNSMEGEKQKDVFEKNKSPATANF